MPLTVEETAERLNVSTYAVYRAIKSGRLRAYRVTEGGPWRVPEGELERILSCCAPEPSNEEP